MLFPGSDLDPQKYYKCLWKVKEMKQSLDLGSQVF